MQRQTPTLGAKIWHLWLRARGHVPQRLSELHNLQSSGADQVRQFQEKLLRSLLLHAWQQCPFWRERLADCGVVRDGEAHLDRFTDLPVLTRDEIQKNQEGLCAQDRDRAKCIEQHTSGSTGIPVVVLQDAEYFEWNRAVKLMFNEWTGHVPGLPQVILVGVPPAGNSLSIKRRIGRWLRSERWFNAFRMLPADMSRYVAEIRRMRPEQIYGYVESVYDLARFIETERLDVPAPRTIVNTAGAMFAPMRQTIERAFHTTVVNRYGCVEAGDIASERPGQSGLIVCPTNLVEILDEDGAIVPPGQSGEIVLTILVNRAMPLIRYRVGDLGRWAVPRSDQASSWPVLAEVEGRSAEQFVTTDGGRVNGLFFSFLLERPFVHRYQVHQRAADYVIVRIVPVGAYDHAPEMYRHEVQELTTQIRKVMGESCRVEFQFVQEIPRSSSGKYRLLTSDIDLSGLARSAESSDQVSRLHLTES